MSKKHHWDLIEVSNMVSLVIFSFDKFFKAWKHFGEDMLGGRWKNSGWQRNDVEEHWNYLFMYSNNN